MYFRKPTMNIRNGKFYFRKILVNIHCLYFQSSPKSILHLQSVSFATYGLLYRARLKTNFCLLEYDSHYLYFFLRIRNPILVF